MARDGIVWVHDTLKPGLKNSPEKMRRRITAVCEYNANDAQNKMRTGARWVDRTGNARQGLFAKAGGGGRERGAGGRFVSGGSKSAYYIVLYHTVPYGIWLEVKWNGKYAIILPTLQATGRNVMQDLNGLLQRRGGLT